MKKSIKEQREILSKTLQIVHLRSSEDNKEQIKSFTQANSGTNLYTYLVDDAWKDDDNRDTKVFLVKDVVRNQIAFYFALNCGILYKDYQQSPSFINEKEKQLYDRYLTALLDVKKKGMHDQEKEKANNEYSNAMGEIYEVIQDSDRATYLISYAEENAEIIEKKDEATETTNDKEHIKHVKETFPAIDIKFFCRNKDYLAPVDLDFKIGVFVFWELIVPHILKISELVGCKYVYLFAADNTEEDACKYDVPDYSDPYYDPYSENEIGNTPVLKLVNYYINELKFRQVSKYTVLKPAYEMKCHTLVQEVSKLQEKREAIWNSHENDFFEEGLPID